jgi:hypothetical protein
MVLSCCRSMRNNRHDHHFFRTHIHSAIELASGTVSVASFDFPDHAALRLEVILRTGISRHDWD